MLITATTATPDKVLLGFLTRKGKTSSRSSSVAIPKISLFLGKASREYFLHISRFIFARSFLELGGFANKISTISLLGLELNSWDLGGQNNFRNEYLKNKEKYFTLVSSLFFVIDIQKEERFDEALNYLEEIVSIILEFNPEFKDLSQFTILFHKFDPDLINSKEILTRVEFLEEKIKSINKGAPFSFYKTTIYDETSLIRAFSEGAIAVTEKSRLIRSLLKDYTKKTFSSAAILLDQQSFIIASRSTNRTYQEICESISPRLAYAIEKLEDWEIDTIDMVTNIKFPGIEKNHREGIIFMKKIDIKKERFYLISLCLNKKIKSKSYEYLPILAANWKNLLENF